LGAPWFPSSWSWHICLHLRINKKKNIN
jgi:hypothetical protein